MPHVKPQKLFTLVFVIAMLGGLTCSGTIAKHETKSTTAESNQDMQQLSASNRSTIVESFILVARDLDTYGLLRGTVPNLPDQAPEFFDSHAVVAIFLGQRRTGGYGIDVSMASDGRITIKELKPPPGSMQKMVLSAPHKIVAVPSVRTTPLSFDLDETWRQRLRSYNITSGDAALSRGTAPKKTFKITGNISVLRTGDVVTFIFDLGTPQLFDVASGKLDSANRVTLSRIAAFDLDTPITNLCSGVVELSNSERDLSLRIEALPSIPPDGPRIVASVKATSSPAKN